MKWAIKIRNEMRHFSAVRIWGIDAEEAQSLIELSLVLPMLFIMLLGATEIGRMAYIGIEVSSAAHAGAAYGAQNLFTAVDVTGMQNAALSDGADISGLHTSSFTAIAAKACQCTNGAIITCSNAGSTCLAPNRILVYVQVNAQATANVLFQISGLPTHYTISRQVVMRVAQ